MRNSLFSKAVAHRLVILVLVIYTFMTFVIIGKIYNAYSLQSTEAQVSIPLTEIDAPIDGTIKQLNVHNGDVVNKGDTLMIINSIDLKDKLNNLPQKLDLSNSDSLYAITKDSDLAIQSSVDGVVTNMNFVEGMNVTQDQMVMKIQINKEYTIQAKFKLNIQEYLKLSDYKNISLQFADQAVAGQILNVSNDIDPITNSVSITFRPTNNLSRPIINQEPVSISMSRDFTVSEAAHDMLDNTLKAIINGFKVN